MENRPGKIVVQKDEHLYFQRQSFPLFAVAYESINNPTHALLHKFSRFWYLTKGKGKVNIQGVSHIVEKGDLVGILPWQYTEVVEVIEEIEFYVVVYERDVVNMVLKNELMALGIKEDLLSSIYHHVKIRIPQAEEGRLINLFDQLHRECKMFESQTDNSADISIIMASTMMIQLMILFYRLSRQDQEHVQRTHHKVQMFHYLYYHINDGLTLKQLAQRFLMSESATAKYIDSMLGITYTQLVSTMKIARLTTMLKYSDESLQELAIYLGYVDAAHISKFFKAKTGKTLASFREEIGGEYDMIPWEVVPNLVKVVIDQFDSVLDKDLLCNQFNFPKHHLNHVFEFYTGMSYAKFINHVRMIKAVEAMFNTDKSLTDIAFSVGFNSVKTFNRHFQKVYKICPIEFRKSMRIQATML